MVLWIFLTQDKSKIFSSDFHFQFTFEVIGYDKWF